MATDFKIVVSAGELSGDQHLAQVIRQLKARLPQAQVKGMGGRHLRDAGVETIVDSEQSGGLMGFLEVFKKLPSILDARKKMNALLRDWKPDLLIVVDYPDFNLRLSKQAKSLGIKVLYFIPPKVWAWRQKRASALGAYTDYIACIFPHEKKFLEERGVRHSIYVGHPFSGHDRFTSPPSQSREEICRVLGLDPIKPLLIFLPGSRAREIRSHMATVLVGLRRAKATIPDLQCIISIAPTISRSSLESIHESWIAYSDISSIDLMKVADFGIIKSGTSTLEATFVHLPFVCVYKATKAAAAIVKALTTIKIFSLPNIIQPDTIVELIQDRCTPEAVADEIGKLQESSYRNDLKKRLGGVVATLQGHDSLPIFQKGDAYSRTADLCLDLLAKRG